MCGGLASIAVLGSFVDAAPQRNEDVIPHWYTVIPVLGVRACNSRMSKHKFWTASRSSRFETILVRFPWLPDVLFSGPQTMPRHYSFGASHSSESWQALQLYDSMLFWCMLPRWGYQMLEICDYIFAAKNWVPSLLQISWFGLVALCVSLCFP